MDISGFCLCVCVNAYVGLAHKPGGDDGWIPQQGWNKTSSSSSFPIRLPLSIITITFKNNSGRKLKKKKRTSSIKCERIPENRKTHTPIGHYMRRHENFPKCKNYFLSSAIPFFGYLRRQCEKIEKKNTFWNFPSQVYYTRDHTVAGIGQSIRPLNWIQVPPHSFVKEKESFELFGRHTRRCGEKIESLPSLFIDRFRMCWSWANNIPLLVPDRLCEKLERVVVVGGLLWSAPLFLHQTEAPRKTLFGENRQGRHSCGFFTVTL